MLPSFQYVFEVTMTSNTYVIFPNFSFSVSAPCPDKSGYVELLFNNLKTVVHCCQFYTMVVRAKFDISSFWLLFNWHILLQITLGKARQPWVFQQINHWGFLMS